MDSNQKQAAQAFLRAAQFAAEQYSNTLAEVSKAFRNSRNALEHGDMEQFKNIQVEMLSATARAERQTAIYSASIAAWNTVATDVLGEDEAHRIMISQQQFIDQR